MNNPNVTYYVPFHSGLSQIEFVAPFLKSGGIVFTYEFNRDAQAVRDYFQGKQQFSNVHVKQFDLNTIIDCVISEKKSIVFLLTASPNYRFGKAQRWLFNSLQSILPNKILDVFVVGHCLFGCQSCGVREHQIPVKFTRFHNLTLEYTSRDASQLWEDEKATKILIAPSVGPLSFLSQKKIIDCLIRVADALPFRFVVKLHGFCDAASNENSLHNRMVNPMQGLSEIEWENTARLREKFVVVPPGKHNILPYLDSSDVVITDVDSSVAFESLYFDTSSRRKRVLAFMLPGSSPPDPEGSEEFLSLLDIYQDSTDLEMLLGKIAKGEKKEGEIGRDFFEKIYGMVDGHEVERIGEKRQWNRALSSTDTSSNISNIKTSLLQKFQDQVGGFWPIDCLALNLPLSPDSDAFGEFLVNNSGLLSRLDVPERLWYSLFLKLTNQIFDAGKSLVFSFTGEDSGPAPGWSVVAKERMKKDSDIFLIQHVWTTAAEAVRGQLTQIPNLLSRIRAISGLELPPELQDEDEEDEEVQEEENEKLNEIEKGVQSEETNESSVSAFLAVLKTAEVDIQECADRGVQIIQAYVSGNRKECAGLIHKLKPELRQCRSIDLDELELCSPISPLWLDTIFPRLEALSLWNNNITDLSELCSCLERMTSLKGIWLSGNPITRKYTSNLIEREIVSSCPQMQIIDRKFVLASRLPDAQSPLEWGIRYISSSTDQQTSGKLKPLSEITEIDLSGRCIQPGFLSPECFKCMNSLEVLDLSDNSRLPLSDVIGILESLPYPLRCIKLEIGLETDVIDWIIKQADSDKGSSIYPFIEYVNERSMRREQAFSSSANQNSVLSPMPAENWTTAEKIESTVKAFWRLAGAYRIQLEDDQVDNRDLGANDGVARWFVRDEVGSRIHHSDSPNCRMVPFFPVGLGITEVSLLWPIQDIEEHAEISRDFTDIGLGESGTKSGIVKKARLSPWCSVDELSSWKDTKYRTAVNGVSTENVAPKYPQYIKKAIAKVYSDEQSIKENLTDSTFKLVESPEDADILWISTGSSSSAEPSTVKEQWLNQNVGEISVTFKHLLSQSVSNTPAQKFIPTCYNMATELDLFLKDYVQRHESGEDNTWISKPWNGARGRDIIISSDHACIVRQIETGPKIAMKYIERPLLFNERKFDLRYILLVLSLDPLQLALYNMFWIRLANRPFALSEFDDYQRHSTVMNYVDFPLTQLHYESFIADFNNQHEKNDIVWNKDVQPRIDKAIKSVFEAAVNPRNTPHLQHHPRTRGFYGVDVMLSVPEEGLKVIEEEGQNNEAAQLEQYFDIPKEKQVQADSISEQGLPGVHILEVNFQPDCSRACSERYDPAFFNNVFSAMFLPASEWQYPNRVRNSIRSI